MGLITRFYGPNAKGSKLTIKEMDDNLYYLQSFGVSGVTYQNNVLTFINPTGGTNNITIDDFYTTGATYNNGIIYFDRNDQLSAYTVNISSLTGDSNTFVTGFTYDNTTNKLIISDNNNTLFDTYIDSFSGLTINGNLSTNTISATTYQNLPPFTFTGGTVNNLIATTISATTYQNLPVDPDTFVTGFTYDNTTNKLIISDNNNTSFDSYIDSFSGLTINGNLSTNTISATTYQNLPVDPDTYVTGFTYSNNKFTIKQNNGQSNLSQIINTVTGFTVNGGLTTTTATVTNRTGTPNQVTSFDSAGKLVAGAGQSTSSSFGSSTLTVTNTTTTFTVLPGISQTITVPSNCFVLITADGGVNTTNTSATAIASVDVAIFIDGNYPTNGGYRRISAHNPSSTAVNSTGIPWSITTTTILSPGSHTIDVRAVYVTGSNMSVSSNNTNPRQAGLYITLIKL